MNTLEYLTRPIVEDDHRPADGEHTTDSDYFKGSCAGCQENLIAATTPGTMAAYERVKQTESLERYLGYISKIALTLRNYSETNPNRL